MKHLSRLAAAPPLWPPALFLLRPFVHAGTGVPGPSLRIAPSDTTAPDGFRRLCRRGVPACSTLAVTLGTMLSLAPGLLPRAAAAQAVLTSVLIVALLGIARLSGHRSTTEHNAGTAVFRHSVLAAGVAGVMVSVAHAVAWQNTLRDAMGVAHTGPEYWSFWAAGTVVLIFVLVAAGSGAARLLRWIGWWRGVALAVAMTLPVAFFGVPGLTASGGADSGLVQPVAMTRSGSADSLVSWSSLGREGQRFVTNGTAGAVQVYVGMRSAPDPASRAELAVRELDRAGGFDRAHLVVAVPTGSGWVDARALRGFEARFGSDFAVAAVQYSHLPSWATFVLGRDSAATSARALFTAIEAHAATLPNPPRLYLYGQSLGALGGSAVFAGAADQNRRACSVLWAGMPGGGGREPGARTAVLANISDPVVHWSLDLLWRPPDLAGARRDAPAPAWLPVASFVQTTADLLGALAAPPGHGHRYDVDQGTALPGCG